MSIHNGEFSLHSRLCISEQHHRYFEMYVPIIVFRWNNERIRKRSCSLCSFSFSAWDSLSLHISLSKFLRTFVTITSTFFAVHMDFFSFIGISACRRNIYNMHLTSISLEHSWIRQYIVYQHYWYFRSIR